MIVALPAVELFKKLVTPPSELVIVTLPAVALFEANGATVVVDRLRRTRAIDDAGTYKEKGISEFVEIVKAFAPELNVIELIVTVSKETAKFEWKY